MIHCKELNKDFESKSELFKALRESRESIIDSKKAVIYNTKGDENKGGVSLKRLDPSKLKGACKGVDFNDDYYYIAVNTINILDGHEDLHVRGTWNRTAKNSQGNVYLQWGHDLSGYYTIVRKEYIEVMVLELPFALLNRPYTGSTEVLVYKFLKTKVIDEKAKSWLESGDEIQASVRMRYIKLLFAANSDAQEDREYKKNFDKYYPEIANKDDFENEILYFWAVLEAANVFESSLVTFGSCPVTGRVTGTKMNDPSKDTQIKEDSQECTLSEFKEICKKNFNIKN